LADELSSGGPGGASGEPDEPATLIGAHPPGHLEAGTLLFGEYEILGSLGEGAMGEVYRARHRDLKALRAIKVMHSGLDRRREALELFLHEAQALLKVHHDAVMACHDLLRDEEGRFYLIMELIEGRSLLAMLREQPLPESAVWALGERLASGLVAAHACGVVHRDVSPDNVLLPGGEPARAKLIDFGLAKHLVEGDRTIVTGFKGKLGYASPEQLGLHGGAIGPRSDVYSLALVLAAAAAGKPIPMGRTLAEALEQRRELPDLRGFVDARRLRAALEPLLACEPEARPDAAAVVEMFREQAPPANVTSAREGVPRRSRFPWNVALRVALVLLVVAGAASLLRENLLVSSLQRERPAEPGVAAGAFAAVREQLLALPAADAGSVWTSPDPVADGAAYSVGFQADCACEALLLSVEGDEVLLLYPNPYEPPRRLAPGEAVVIPSSAAYQLEAEGSGEEDTLVLLLRRDPFGFPAEGFGGEPDLWRATGAPEDAARLRELGALLDGDLAGSARGVLSVVAAKGSH
jgi:serine/threonine-protein kinase